MRQPLEYASMYYTEAVMALEKEWQRPLTDHEKNILIQGYKMGRTAEAENEIKILYIGGDK